MTLKKNRARAGEDPARKPKKRTIVLVTERFEYIDDKDTDLLQRFLSERSKIRGRRVDVNDAQQQRDIAAAIKNARELALLPYDRRGVSGVLVLGPRAAVARAFAKGLDGLDELTDGGRSEVSDEVLAQAHEAGERFVAAQRWAAITGDRVDTATLRQRLGISRQALKQRVEAGTLLAVPGTGTSWYPTCQFREANGTDRLDVRPVVAQILQRFRDRLTDVRPLTIISWAATMQPELEGMTPRDWIAAERDDEQVLNAADRTAAALAR